MGLSIRAYARHRGVSHPAVVKAVQSGRIKTESDGTIDPVKADVEWDRLTRQTMAQAAVEQPTVTVAQVAHPKASAQTVRPVVTETPAEMTATAAPTSPSSDDTRGVDYHKARAVRETYAARLAKLEFEERTGKLINADEVKVKHFNLARRLRDRIQQIPRKVAPQIVAAVVAQPDQRVVEDLLMDAIREALEELSR